MVPLLSLALPILLAAVLVFIVSSVIHMLLPIHKHDLRPMPDEEKVQDALRPFNLAPGDYALPHMDASTMKDPVKIERMTRGPVALVTVMPSGPPAMGASLVLWFLYSVLVGVFAAYLTGRALGPGASYLEVFRFAGASAFMGYSLALLQQSIWWHKNWAATLRSVADGLIYALMTAGAFGWLWPRG
jgi:hypothetical protein